MNAIAAQIKQAQANASQQSVDAGTELQRLHSVSGSEMSEQPECKNCDSTGWVCEAHPDHPWEDTPLKCGCGAPGAPCPHCNPCDKDHAPRDMPGFVVHVARADKPSFAEEAAARLLREAGGDVNSRDSYQSTPPASGRLEWR